MPDLILLIYQWLMYGLLISLTGVCVIGQFLDQASREAKRARRARPPRRATSSMRFLRPSTNPISTPQS